MRALALEFPEDIRTHDITDEFLFGPSLLGLPVTQPMYYAPADRGRSAMSQDTRQVYLPQGARWFDFWSGKLHDGGQAIVVAEAPLERIPLFVRAGSILPMTEPMQFVDEVPKRRVRTSRLHWRGCNFRSL